MASIHVGNTKIEDDKIWAGNKTNPYCYVGDTQFYPDEEFEKWKVSKVSIKYYSNSGSELSGNNRILRANGANYCVVKLTLRKGKQKKRTGEWKQVLNLLLQPIEEDVYPTAIYSYGDGTTTVGSKVAWDDSTNKLRWNNSGYYYNHTVPGGNTEIICYYQNSNYNGGDTIIADSTHDLMDGVSNPVINLQANTQDTTYSISNLSFPTGGYGSSTRKVPASGTTITISGTISYNTHWTTGAPIGSGTLPSASGLSVVNTIPDGYYNTIEDTYIHYGTGEGDYYSSFSYWGLVYYDSKFQVTIPSLLTQTVYDGWYNLQIGYNGATSNILKIYQADNYVDESSKRYVSNWWYDFETPGSSLSIPGLLEVPFDKDYLYIDASAKVSYNYVSGSPNTSQSGGVDISDELFLIYNDGSEHVITWTQLGSYRRFQIPMGDGFVSQGSVFTISLYRNNTPSTTPVVSGDGTHLGLVAQVRKGTGYALDVSGANSSGEITDIGWESTSYTIEIIPTLDGEYYDGGNTYSGINITPTGTNSSKCSVKAKTEWTHSGNSLYVPVIFEANDDYRQNRLYSFRITHGGGALTITLVLNKKFPIYTFTSNSDLTQTISASTTSTYVTVASLRDDDALVPDVDYLSYWCVIENSTGSKNMNLRLPEKTSELPPPIYYIGGSLVQFFFLCDENTTQTERSARVILKQQDTTQDTPIDHSPTNHYWTGKDDLVFNITQEAAPYVPPATEDVTWEWYSLGGTSWTIKLENNNGTNKTVQLSIYHYSSDSTDTWNGTWYAEITVPSYGNKYLTDSGIIFVNGQSADTKRNFTVSSSSSGTPPSGYYISGTGVVQKT